LRSGGLEVGADSTGAGQSKGSYVQQKQGVTKKEFAEEGGKKGLAVSKD